MMIFNKSLKQLLRTPLTTALFIALLTISAFFVSCGTVIWVHNQAAIKAYEDVFITIGTVRQRASSMEIAETWDAFDKQYMRRSTPSYSTIVLPSILDFDGAGYIINPEMRPYYGAWRPDLIQWPEDTLWLLQNILVVEITPLESYLPDSPAEVMVTKVLSDNSPHALKLLEEGEIILLCDHRNDDPKMLYAGKTYIMCIGESGSHNSQAAMSSQLEWWPQKVVFSTQYHPDGTRIEDSITPSSITEVTEGFFETEEGRRWLEFARSIPNYSKTLPVLPTNGTQLLLPFYNGTASIVEGEDITPKEYENGDRVCLVSENFAKMNGFSMGDMLLLPLYYADYQKTPSESFIEVDHSRGGMIWWDIDPPLTAEGEPYSVFSEHEYMIKGIYTGMRGSDAAYALGANTVVIPMLSVRESDENNILSYGPMKDTNTSFQISNGSIESFMENWLLQGNDDLEFTFHDRGYTHIHRGLENMKRISLLFLAVGSAMSLALVFFFCYVYISKNKMRTAIERMLGYTKKQCAISLLSGFLLAAVLAVTIGCAAGTYAQGRITESLVSQDYYDTSFTIGPLGQDGASLAEPKPSISALYAPIAGLVLFLITTVVSAAFMSGNINEEPLKLLSGVKVRRHAFLNRV